MPGESPFSCDNLKPPHDGYYSKEGHTHSGGGGAAWGGITGTLGDQVDLAGALAGKASTSHNHALNNLSEKSYNSLTDKPAIPAAIGYTLLVQALTSSPADSATVYFGSLPKAPTTSANISKIRIPKTGTIKRAFIYCYSGTAGTNESWSLYIRLNNSSDTLIKTLAVSASERIFDNDALNISVSAGDYIEIKGVQPLWATNPLTTIYGGYLYIE